METYKGISFEKVSKQDSSELTTIMKRAFDEDAKRHLNKDCGGPPGYDNGDFINKWYLNSGSEAYKIIKGGVLIGGLNLYISSSNRNHLGNIFIDVPYQDQGIGKIVWEFIENKYPNTLKWITETPGFSKRNHHFYINKCGFRVVRIDHPKDKYEESYILEKTIK